VRFEEFDIRFGSKETEAAFKAELESEVISYGAMGNLLLFAGAAVTASFACVHEVMVHDSPYRFFDSNARTLSFVIWVSVPVVYGVVFALNLLRQWLGWLSAWDFERLNLFPIFFAILMTSFSCMPHAAWLCGEQADAVWSSGALGIAADIPLAIVVQIVCMSQYIPLRSCCLWIVPVFAIGTFVVMSAIAVGGARQMSTSMGLYVAAIVTFRGSHRVEKDRRAKWLRDREQQSEIRQSSALAQSMCIMAGFFCDVLVKLDDDFRVLGTDSKQHAFFHNNNIEGRRITELFSESENARFSTTAAQTVVSGLPGCLSSLLILKNETINVSMFIVHISEGPVRYALGISAQQLSLGENVPWADPEKEMVPRQLLERRYGEVDHENRQELADLLDNPDHELESNFTSPTQRFEEVADQTELHGKMSSINFLLKRWNLPRAHTTCCKWHGYVHVLADVTRKLAADPCQPGWCEFDGWRCSRCTCLRPDRKVYCAVCEGHEPDETRLTRHGRLDKVNGTTRRRRQGRRVRGDEVDYEEGNEDGL